MKHTLPHYILFLCLAATSSKKVTAGQHGPLNPPPAHQIREHLNLSAHALQELRYLRDLQQQYRELDELMGGHNPTIERRLNSLEDDIHRLRNQEDDFTHPPMSIPLIMAASVFLTPLVNWLLGPKQTSSNTIFFQDGAFPE